MLYLNEDTMTLIQNEEDNDNKLVKKTGEFLSTRHLFSQYLKMSLLTECIQTLSINNRFKIKLMIILFY